MTTTDAILFAVPGVLPQRRPAAVVKRPVLNTGEDRRTIDATENGSPERQCKIYLTRITHIMPLRARLHPGRRGAQCARVSNAHPGLEEGWRLGHDQVRLVAALLRGGFPAGGCSAEARGCAAQSRPSGVRASRRVQE